MAGAAIVALARRFLPGDGGHRPLAGLTGGNPVLAAAPGIALAAIGTLAFGAVLGPEGPLIALGSLVGLSITVFTRLETQEQRMVATAGSFAAISALFGGPVVAGVMMVEAAVGLGAMAIPACSRGSSPLPSATSCSSGSTRGAAWPHRRSWCPTSRSTAPPASSTSWSRSSSGSSPPS